MNKAGVYIFDSADGFLEAMEQIEYQPQPIYITKPIDNINAVRKEIDFLEQCTINVADYFPRCNIIKINFRIWKTWT